MKVSRRRLIFRYNLGAMGGSRNSNSAATNGSIKKGKDALSVEFKPPSPQEEKKEEIKTISFFKLFQYATGLEKVLLWNGTLFAILCGCFLPFVIIFYGEYTTLLVDRSTPNKTTISPTLILAWLNGGRQTDGTEEDRRAAIKEDASLFGAGYAVFGVLQFFVAFICITSLNYSALLQTAKLRRKFLKAVLRQDISWYDSNNVNSVPSKLIEDLDKIQEGIGEKIGIFVQLIMGFIMNVTMAFFYGWKLTLVMLTCAPVLIFANALVARVQTNLTIKEAEAYGSARSVAEEVFSSIKTVMAFSGEKKEIERYEQELEYSLKTGIRKGFLSGLGGGIMWFITYCCYALAFWYGVSLILESRLAENFEYTPAVLIITFFGVLVGAINLGQSTPHLEAFAVARGAGASVFAILNRIPEIDSLSDKGTIPLSFKGEIEFKNVGFRYPARPEVQVLKGFNLKVKKGEVVALVGSSGCGKSTTMQLLQRFYDPSEGLVQLDCLNAKELNVRWLRQQFGVVGQEPTLFATTIYDNIRYGLESATKENVEEAAKLANAHDFIMKLPNGYQTMLGPKGSQISGGQKQRIAIARALIRNPKILLLDEATSALDAANERKVQEALDKAAEGRTTLIVTHKLSAIAKADRIVVLSGGRVVEEGSHEELVKRKGHYFKLLEMQKLNEKGSESMEDEYVEGSFFGDHRTSITSVKSLAKDVKSNETAVVEQEKLSSTSMLKILKYNKQEWWAILIGTLSTLMVGGSIPALSVLFGELYGLLSDNDPDLITDTTALYSGLLLGLGVLTGITTFLQLYLFNYAGVKLTNRFRKLGFSAILRQEASWFDEEAHRPGALCAKLSGDAADIQGATGSRIGIIVQSASTLLIGAGLGFSYSWKMTLVTIAVAPIIFVGVYFESKIIEGKSFVEKKSIEGATQVSVEAISNIRTVASLGREQTFIDLYDKELMAGEKNMKFKSYLRGSVFGLGTSVPYFSYGIALWYGGILMADGELHYKIIIKVTEALLFGMWILAQSMAFAPNFNQAKISAARLFQLLERTPKMKDGEVTKDSNWKADGNVRISNVDFAYPTRPGVQVLEGLNLHIPESLSIALVGPSGCGKSTVIQLLQRLYDPSKGNVFLDNDSISSLKISSLRQQFGIVSQEPVLFDKTIAANIAYGDNSRDVTEAEIIEASKKANIHEFITSLPLGYETKVGAGGTHLSGGQKQRIAIARALIRNPKILLLDEATSALDAESESVVQAALDSASSGRTTITVGHRMGAIKKADVIYHLDKGRIRQRNTQKSEIKTYQNGDCVARL